MNLSELRGYARFVRGLPRSLRETITYEDAISTIKMRLASREDSFVRLLEGAVFANPRSPYLKLLKIADCDFEDIKKMVRNRGLESTLRELRAAGVYVRFEEFKGREPIVRNGQEISSDPAGFDNIVPAAGIPAPSSGSTGTPTPISYDLESFAQSGPLYLATLAAHEALHVPTAGWREIPPSSVGIWLLLLDAKIGQFYEKWFSPISHRETNSPLASRLATLLLLAAGRRSGLPIVGPEHLHPMHAVVLARWAENKLKSGGKALIRTTPNLAVRVCLAAAEAGIDLSGTTFTLGGEPTTEAKAREMSAVGANPVPTYAAAESGSMGFGCARPVASNDNHVMKDQIALIHHPRPIPALGLTVDAFMVTTLRMRTSKFLLNVEIDDYGVVEDRNCGCLLGELGYTTHVRDIYSFSKATSEGVTLMQSDLIHILEKLLPARFGGSSLDYQMIEEEDERGLTRLSIAVDPNVHISNEQEVVDIVLGALRTTKGGIDGALFASGGTLQVKRMSPIASASGKLMPLHSVRKVHKT